MTLPLEDRIDAIREQFPAVSRTGYYNTGTIGPLPKNVLLRHQEREREFHFGGPLDRSINEALAAEFKAVRGKLARTVHAAPECIAFVENTTAGINSALLSRSWEPGEEVITTDAEHPAVRMPLAYLAHRYGVVVRQVPSADPAAMPAAVEEMARGRARAVVMSHVSFSSGGAFPVAAICRVAREQGLLSVIDGAQSVGAIEVDVPAIDPDYYAFPGYKWVLGPQGTAALYASPRTAQTMPYRIASRAVAERLADGGFRLHPDARRFEGTGTTALHDFVTLGDSLDYLAGLGHDNVLRRIGGLRGRFVAGLIQSSWAELITPAEAAYAAGLISFRVRGREAGAVRDELGRRGMTVRTVPGDAIRASFHIYNTPGEVDALLAELHRIAAV